MQVRGTFYTLPVWFGQGPVTIGDGVRGWKCGGGGKGQVIVIETSGNYRIPDCCWYFWKRRLWKGAKVLFLFGSSLIHNRKGYYVVKCGENVWTLRHANILTQQLMCASLSSFFPLSIFPSLVTTIPSSYLICFPPLPADCCLIQSQAILFIGRKEESFHFSIKSICA